MRLARHLAAPPTLESTSRRLSASAGGVLAVVLATLLLSPHSGGFVGTTTPAMVFLIFVLAASLAGRRPAGLVTAALALLSQWYFFVPPKHSFSAADTRNWISLAVFALAELVVCAVGASQADARLRAERASAGALALQRFTTSLSRALTAEAVYEATLGEGRELLGADAAMVALPTADGAAIELVATLRVR